MDGARAWWRAVALGGASALVSACTPPVTLHAPDVAPTMARDDPTPINLAPIALPAQVPLERVVVRGETDMVPPDPSPLLTAGMKAELGGRALHGGEPGGYAVACTLQRFAIRAQRGVAGLTVFAALYVDLACDAQRAVDHATVWRGLLRGRGAAAAANLLGNEKNALQRATDRMTADVTRELAADLASRALGLAAVPSARVFKDEAERADLMGVDDGPYGWAALATSVDGERAALQGLSETSAPARASAWNAIAMAQGPDERWPAEAPTKLDDESMVRFFQYKALARAASPTTLGVLRQAAAREDESVLAELVEDALASGGLGLAKPARAANAAAATSGATTKP